MTDVNGVRHHLLLGRDDWQHCDSPDVPRRWMYDDAAQGVTLAPVALVFPQPPGDAMLTQDQRRGASRDFHDTWYWIGDDGLEIRVRWPEANASSHYWAATDDDTCSDTTGPFHPVQPPAPADPEPLAGLAVTTHHYLVVGSRDRGELLIFDLLTTGTPPTRVALQAPAGSAETPRPWDIAPLKDGGVIVLDRAHHWVWRLDAAMRVQPSTTADGASELFQPAAGDEDRRGPSSTSQQPLTLLGVTDPVSIEPLPDGSFLLLDLTSMQASTVRRFGADGLAAGAVELLETNLRLPDEPELWLQDPLAPRPGIVLHDIAFVATGDDSVRPGVLYGVDTGGNQAFAFDVTLTANSLALHMDRTYYPLRSHTGKALVAPLNDDAAYFDQGERWLQVVGLGRPRYEESAVIELPILDGKDPGCVWHRLDIDACIPPDTQVRVWSRASDDRDSLRLDPWSVEPPLYHRGDGAEVPHYDVWSGAELTRHAAEAQRAGTPQYLGTWELLFQNTVGRYGQVLLELTGNGRASPLLRSARVHYPRFSYLREYLPDVYQEDATSASFLERFLANPEGLLTKLEGQVADAQAAWDVHSAGAEALEWLAGWIGMVLDPAWSEAQRRLLLAHAARFYNRRGTLTGLAWIIRLAIDEATGPELFDRDYDDLCTPVRIVERFRTRHAPGVVSGDPNDLEAATGSVMTIARERAHRFTVLLPAEVPPLQVALVERIAQAEKPAHTWVTVRRFWDHFRVGEARLGMDTRLGEGGRFATFELGATGLAEGALGTGFPYDVTDRTVLSR